MKPYLFISAFVLTGCASGLQVTYLSDPPGAAIYEGDKPFGRTPLTLTYAADATFKAGGCQRLRGTTARWISGAEAAIGWLDACASVGSNQVYTFRRPPVPGVEIDANYAGQREAADAARIGAAAVLLGAQRAFTPQPLQLKPIELPKRTNCRSYWLGDVLQTTCN